MYSNPVKDWFYFTRQQRKGMVVLTVIIFAIPLTARVIEDYRQPHQADTERFQEAIMAFEQLEASVLLPSREQANADHTGGLQRERSGDMPGALAREADKPKNTEKGVSHTMSSGTGTHPVMVNISTADTTELRLVRGIGPVFSRRIVRYRELLGGYHCITQLQEVFGIDSLRYGDISNQVTADSIHIRKMDVNQVTFPDLLRHPYVDRRIATAIINLRDQHGPFASAKEIKRSYIIDECQWQRLAPYLSPE